MLFLLCSPLRSSVASVVFDFNASLSDVAPVSPISFTVDFMRIEKIELLMDTICVLFPLSSPHSWSDLSVVFDFSASLSAVAPLSLISLPVDDIQHKSIKHPLF